MPKIPVYEQQVKMVSGSLGPRAGAGLEAPGQALASFGKQVGDTAFKYGMMEKEAEVKATAAEFEDGVVQTTTEFARENKDTTATAAKKRYNDQVAAPALQKLDTMDLTANQKRDVRARLQRQLTKGSISVQQAAANNGKIVRGGLQDKRLAALQKDFATTSDPELKEIYINEANKLISESQLTGDRISYNAKSWRNGAVSEDVATRVNSANSNQHFEDAKKSVRENTGYTQVEKAQQEAIIATKQAAFITEQKKRINGEVFAAMLTEDEFNEAMKQASTGDIVINRGDEQIAISLSGLPNDERLNVVTSLRTQRNIKVSEEERSAVELHSTTFASKSPAALQSDLDDLRAGTGFAEGMSLRVRTSLESIVSTQIKDRVPMVTSQIASNTAAIKSRLSLSNGVPDETTADDIQETVELYNSLGDEAGATAFAAEVEGISSAGALYSSVKYKSDAAILNAGLALKQEIVREGATVEEINKAQATLTAFNAMVANRQEKIKNDPVDFLQSANRGDLRDQEATLTPKQLIEKQVAMNIPDGDIRILSNAQVTAFQTQYKGLTTYADKSDYAVGFLADYNPDDQNRIMRNLIKSDAITLVDSMIIANPGNAAMFAVDAGNNPESAKAISALFTPTERKDVAALVAAKNTDYTGSVIGGQIEGMVSRGATAARMLHATTMNSIITNTALYYKSVDTNISDDDAVEKAIGTVVNSQFSFGNVNGKPLRFPSGMASDAAEISKKLESSLSNTKYLGSVVDVPADSPFSRKLPPDQAEQAYASELANSGYWVTTSDNQGAYLVDQNGNMVPRKAPIDGFDGAAITPSDMFVMVKFADVKSTVDEINILKEALPVIGFDRISAAAEISLKEKRPIF